MWHVVRSSRHTWGSCILFLSAEGLPHPAHTQDLRLLTFRASVIPELVLKKAQGGFRKRALPGGVQDLEAMSTLWWGRWFLLSTDAVRPCI